MASKLDKRTIWLYKKLYDNLYIEGVLQEYSPHIPAVLIHIIVVDGTIEHKILLLKEKVENTKKLNNKYEPMIDNFINKYQRRELIRFLFSKTKNKIIMQSLARLEQSAQPQLPA